MLETAMFSASQSSTACCDYPASRHHSTSRPTRGSSLSSTALVPSLAVRLSFELDETPGSNGLTSVLRTLERRKSLLPFPQGHTALLGAPEWLIPPQNNADWDMMET
jgi:hypothetical protein